MASLSSQIVGHSENISKLDEMLSAKRLPPVLLFLGPEGIGKKRIAFSIGQKLVCTNGTGCGSCGPCLRVDKRESESVRLIAPDGAQIKVEQTRAILDELSLQTTGQARVWIFDQAEKLNTQAANSLLKSFEEPPADCYFILVTSSQAQILPTIRSRSQVLRFHSLSNSELRKLRQASDWAYVSAQGQVGRLDQLTQPAYDELRKKSFKFLIGATKESQTWASLQIKELLVDRDTTFQVLGFWQQFVRDLALKSQNLEPLIHQDLLQSLHTSYPPEVYQDMHHRLMQADRDLSGNVDKTLVFESLCRAFQESAR
jgi:DNA polymerase-3 subunit delta'